MNHMGIQGGSAPPRVGEIPPQFWPTFLQRFGLEHQGWIADVSWPGMEPEDLSPYGEALSDEYVEHRLEGIKSELSDSGEHRILIDLSGNRRVILSRPERIEVRETDESNEKLLAFEASGIRCHLHLRFPAADKTSMPVSRFL